MDISKMGALFPKPVASPAQSLGQVSKYNSKNYSVFYKSAKLLNPRSP